MLIQLSIENYLSFKEKVTFSMVKGRPRSFPHHVVEIENFPQKGLLKTAIVYGANASGKSNFVKAIDFFQDLIVLGTRLGKTIPHKPFVLDKDWINKPTEFIIEFISKGRSYSYGISFDSKIIHQEWLYEIQKTTEKMLFERNVVDGKHQFKFGSWINSISEEEIQFINFTAKGTRLNQPFLTESIERNINYFKDVYHWIKDSLTIIFPDREFGLGMVLYDEEKSTVVNEIIHYLDIFGTGIVDYNLNEINLKELLSDETLLDIEKNLEAGSVASLRNASGKRKAFVRKDKETNELKGDLLTLLHRSTNPKGGFVQIDPEDESDGTIRLIDLIPILISLTNQDSVFVIDEFDRSIHPNLSFQFMKLFLENSIKETQLIVTTHEENLLDLELLRRDEIWFVEKDYYGSSHLYSLEEFKPRKDKDIRKGYLQGRFGAIPILRSQKF